MAQNRKKLQALNREITGCRKCARLVAWREQVARDKVRRFAAENYWGKPVPGFGDPDARLLIVGLAPAAHGANRTGRMFTGDRSGEWLYRSLHRFGFANQAEARDRDDGLRLSGCYITAALRCAPPQNKPTADERRNCFPYLCQEVALLHNLKVVVALGRLAFDTSVKMLRELGHDAFARKPVFGHGAEVAAGEMVLLASYHPSQQNTFTGKLTEAMFDAIFRRCRELLDDGNR
ncbi:MAG: uracil-DNA glycosylase [Calditrichaeota bacterium]|nr:MAG: uracil-DNA glycosylase [Calditrichota bacterium]